MTRQNRNKTIAVVVTVAVHVIVLLLLVYMALITPLPLPGEAGVEVNLGMYNEGQGNMQQPKPKPVVNAPKPQPQQPKEETVTQDTEEAPAIEEPKPKKKEEPKVNERALFKPVNKPEEQPSSEGITGNPGDQGNPNGGQNVNSYDGQGGSATYDLGGRNSIGDLPLPDINKDNEQQGTRIVVINIWVNRQGIVTKAEINYKKTSANSSYLERNKSKEAAFASRFAPAGQDAPELQLGTITYTYKQTK